MQQLHKVFSISDIAAVKCINTSGVLSYLISAAIKTPMSLVIVVALALDCGSWGPNAFVSVVWPVSVFFTGAEADLSTELWWCCIWLRIVLVLPAVYGIIFIQCLHIVCVLSVTLLPFIISAGYPKCCQTDDLKVAGASSMVIPVFSDVILAACCFPSFSSSSSFPSPSLGSGRLDVANAHYFPHRSQVEAQPVKILW